MSAAHDLSEEWVGKQVRISGCGGIILLTAGGNVKTGGSREPNHILTIERADPAAYGHGWVAFRAHNGKYLTQHLYGEGPRAEIADALFQVPNLLPELVPQIIDYVVDKESAWEGEGFNYRPMTADPGPPNVLQVFALERTTRGRRSFGVRSRFGRYWRSEHWNKVVSQSPHCLGDETWFFEEL